MILMFVNKSILCRSPKILQITYLRRIKGWMLDGWKTTSRRNTGVRLSWQYSPPPPGDIQPDQRYLEANKHFILLANGIHQHHGGLTGDLQELLDDIREKKMWNMYTGCTEAEEKSKLQDLLSKRYENIAAEAIHKDDITEETLEIAAEIYFTVVTCPFVNSRISSILQPVHRFYKDLFERQSLETALKSLARILYVMVNENEKVYQYEEYNVAKALFDKVTTVLKLKNRDIAMMTTAASELERYQGQTNFTPNLNITQSKENQNKLG